MELSASMKKLPLLIPGAALTVISLVFTAKRCLTLDSGTMQSHLFVMLMLLLILTAGVLLMMHLAPKLSLAGFWLGMGLCTLALLVRALFFDFQSLDYTTFLSQWVEEFRVGGGFAAVKKSVGDYNLPYLYFIALISYSKTPDLYLIKLFSIFFDYLLAYGCGRLVYLLTKSEARKLCAFFFVLFLPSVLINGAAWAQCDSIYAAFCVFALYLALADCPTLSVISIALAFSYKLQTVFIMPIYIPLLIQKRVGWRSLLAFPAVYAVLTLPAVLLGKPLLDTVAIYANQVGSYSGSLTLNAPSLFALLPSSESAYSFLLWLGIALAFLLVAGVCIPLLIHRAKAPDNRQLFLTAFLFTLAIPFLLPKMHERYFFLADVLALAVACVWVKRSYLPLLVEFASFGVCFSYLNRVYIYSFKLCAVAMLAAVLLTGLAVLRDYGIVELMLPALSRRKGGYMLRPRAPVLQDEPDVPVYISKKTPETASEDASAPSDESDS